MAGITITTQNDLPGPSSWRPRGWSRR